MDIKNKFAELVETSQELEQAKNKIIDLSIILDLSERDKTDLISITKRMEKKIKKEMLNLVND